MGLLDFINPWAWRADRRGVRELRLAEEREAAQRRAKLAARYETSEPPGISQPSISIATGPLENPSMRTTYGEKSVKHVFLIACGGPSFASEVAVWLACGEDRQVRRTDEAALGLLRPTDPERRVELVETNLDGGGMPRHGALMCRWTDVSGEERTEALLDVTVHV